MVSSERVRTETQSLDQSPLRARLPLKVRHQTRPSYQFEPFRKPCVLDALSTHADLLHGAVSSVILAVFAGTLQIFVRVSVLEFVPPGAWLWGGVAGFEFDCFSGWKMFEGMCVRLIIHSSVVGQSDRWDGKEELKGIFHLRRRSHCEGLWMLI